MDLATSLGLAAGVGIMTLVILMGGDLHMFVSEHAAILIFGGCTAATMIRFPFSAIVHGVAESLAGGRDAAPVLPRARGAAA